MKLEGLNFQSGAEWSLKQAVAILPSNVKVAFYGAIQRKGTLNRGTWSGCAFNATGNDEWEVHSTVAAMEKFGASSHVVTRFIICWDLTAIEYDKRLNYHIYKGDTSKIEYYATNTEATLALADYLESAGLFNEPHMAKVARDEAQVDMFLAENFFDDLDAEIQALIEAAEVLTS